MLTALISGILCGEYFNMPPFVFYAILSGFSLIFFAVYTFSGTSKTAIDLLLVAIVFICGLSLPPHQPPLPVNYKDYQIKGKCEEQLANNNYILSVHGQLFYLSGINIDTTYQKEDSLSFRGIIHPLKNNSNLGEFSYTQHLRQKGVYFQVIPLSRIEHTGQPHNLLSLIENYRQELLQKTFRLLKDSTHSTLVNALCLGYQTDMDDGVRQLFISTGTIHLLSVSGLHCGAIYLFIIFLFKITGLSGRKSNLLIIPLIWGYALLTGLSPSVVRAATILSFITFGKAFNEDYTPLNAIAASAFFTLLIQPLAIYSISFQMSYAAYTGIITLYPFLNRLPGKLPLIPQKLYSSVCVTLAAQLPTLPICAYYFHTISINSFLVNIVAIPIATLLLYSATLLILLPAIIGVKIAFITNLLCGLLLYVLQLFDHISINLQHLYPSGIQVLLLYMVIAATCLFLIRHSTQLLRLSILSATILLGYSCLYNYYLHSGNEIIVFNIHQKSCILLRQQGYYRFLKNDAVPLQKIMPYVLKNKLQPAPTPEASSPSGIIQKHNRIESDTMALSIIDARNQGFSNSNILIITGNTPPDRIYRRDYTPYPTTIITDGSNTISCIRQWERFCMQRKIRLHQTRQSGSVSLTLK